MSRRRSAGALLALAASGCASWPADRNPSCPDAALAPTLEPAGQDRFATDLSVLIFNVEGLPWPARKGRGPSLKRIGEVLGRMRQQGNAPDIVLMQEAFTSRAARIGTVAGYPYALRGPTKRDVPRQTLATPEHIAARNRKKGELRIKLLSSGLYVLSEYPVIQTYRRGYSHFACAGYDCLSAKGVMLVRVVVPGLPAPVDIFTTHMNAGKASGVDKDRATEAHRFQAIEAAVFLDQTRESRNPLIIGGDFNMRRNKRRFDFFSTNIPYEIVHQRCVEQPARCEVKMSWDGDAPWMDTQDLQAFEDGDLVDIEPVRVEALFDGPETGGKLSDHDGFLVNYRLSWSKSAQPMPLQCSGPSRSSAPR